MSKVKIQRGNEYTAFHNSGMRKFTAWNELIDNSIDNEATEILFNYSAESVTIIDNGTGIEDNDNAVGKVLHFYESNLKDDSTKIGNYGIGLKEATMRLGEGILIRSKAKGCNPIQIDVPWAKGVDEVEYNIVENGIDVGCSIQIYDELGVVKPTLVSFKYYDKIIKAGKLTIYDCDGSKYIPQIDPIFDGKPQILNNISIGGRKFNAKIGILSKTVKGQGGFYVYSVEQLRYYHYQQITIGDEVRAGEGLYVEIGLINAKSDWIADKNKQGILDIDIIANHLDEVYLPRWRQKLYNEKSVQVLDEIELTMNKHFGLDIGEEKRNTLSEGDPSKLTGSIEPTQSGVKRKRAAKISSHDYKVVERRHGGKLKGVKITEAHFNNTSKYMSISYEGKRLIIRLNKDNSFMNSLLVKPSDIKKQMLKHLIHIGITANSIEQNELLYIKPIDIIMNQHELLE